MSIYLFILGVPYLFGCLCINIEICKWLIEESGSVYGGNNSEYDGIMLFAKIALAKDALINNDLIKANQIRLVGMS